MRKCAEYRAKAIAHARLAMLSRSDEICETHVRIAASFLTLANKEAMCDLRASGWLKPGPRSAIDHYRTMREGVRGMSEIMTRCPVIGQAVATGLTTDSVIFESIPNVDTRMNCPVRGREH
jgi:hypothetical protein